MGTRNLVAVQLDGIYRVAQYGQWDGYPSGQGATVLNFLRNEMDRPLFESKLRAAHFMTTEQAEALGSRWKETHGYLSRDTGGEILAVVQNAPTGIGLLSQIDFAGDSLMCEWVYVVDFDKNTLEIFKGFNKQKLAPTERFASAPVAREGEYQPVKWLHTFYLDMLPDEQFFIGVLEPREEEEEAWPTPVSSTTEGVSHMATKKPDDIDNTRATARERTKLLIARVNRCYPKYDEPKDTAPVAAARKLIKDFDSKVGKLRDAARKEQEKLKEQAREKVYFAKPSEALAAVQKLETISRTRF